MCGAELDLRRCRHGQPGGLGAEDERCIATTTAMPMQGLLRSRLTFASVHETGLAHACDDHFATARDTPGLIAHNDLWRHPTNSPHSHTSDTMQTSLFTLKLALKRQCTFWQAQRCSGATVGRRCHGQGAQKRGPLRWPVEPRTFCEQTGQCTSVQTGVLLSRCSGQLSYAALNCVLGKEIVYVFKGDKRWAELVTARGTKALHDGGGALRAAERELQAIHDQQGSHGQVRRGQVRSARLLGRLIECVRSGCARLGCGVLRRLALASCRGASCVCRRSDGVVCRKRTNEARQHAMHATCNADAADEPVSEERCATANCLRVRRQPS